MFRSLPSLLVVTAILFVSGIATAQIDDICREAGVVPSLDSPFANIPYIYGRVTLAASDERRPPKITVIFWDREQSETRWTVGKSGYYCFKRNNPNGGLLVVEVNGIEAARRNLPSFGPNQQREDFDVMPPEIPHNAAPTSISAKFSRPPNDKTSALYGKAADMERGKRLSDVLGISKEIVAIDPDDFIAWAKLGTVNFELNDLPAADAAFRRALEIRVDYTPAWINVGKLRIAQKQFAAAVEIFKHSLVLEPNTPRYYQLLGEAYLYDKRGTLGAEALNHAIALDPVGMADCHVLLAKLYDLAGQKANAAREYSLLLEKVKDHPDRKKFEKYIKENRVQ
jgi:tetratricopeptide (TPR) repeat protein